jgi:hypothetical protein
MVIGPTVENRKVAVGQLAMGFGAHMPRRTAFDRACSVDLQ